MPKIHQVKAKKSYPCSKCGEQIEQGAEYLYYTLRPGGPGSKGTKYRRHTGCRPKPSELTSSEYLSAVYSAQESFDAAVSSGDLDTIINAADEAIATLEEARDGCQERLDNMPEGLQQGDTGQMLQERIDACEATISEIEDLKSTIESKQQDIDDLRAEDDAADEDSTEDDKQQQIDDLESDAINDAESIGWPE